MIMTSRLKVIGAGLCTVLALSSVSPVKADALSDIGLTQLLAEVGNGLNGDGIIVGMVEASASLTNAEFQFDPSTASIKWGINGVPVWFFQSESLATTYTTTPGTAHQYDASQGSGHATGVASNYSSIASGVDKVEVFNADYFIDSILRNRTGTTWQPVEVDSRVLSQSYIIPSDNQAAINSEYSLLFDAYANRYGTFFVNGVQNSQNGLSYAPGTMYNGITVGNQSGGNSLGVHIVAPQSTSSDATPMVAGAAAVLLQAAEQKYGTSSTTPDVGAADNRVLKALLINGANKAALPSWGNIGLLSNGLDQRYGAGMLNIYNSYQTLMSGRLVTSTTASPTLQTMSTGWDLTTIATGTSNSNSYFFNVSPESVSAAANTITATLTWNSVTTDVVYSTDSQTYVGNNLISDFSLGLYRIDDGNAVLVSLIDSADSNVEHLYLTGLTEGIYELRVTLDSLATNITNGQDIYALAFSLGQVPEPSTALLICLGATYSLLSRRRKSAA